MHLMYTLEEYLEILKTGQKEELDYEGYYVNKDNKTFPLKAYQVGGPLQPYLDENGVEFHMDAYALFYSIGEASIWVIYHGNRKDVIHKGNFEADKDYVKTIAEKIQNRFLLDDFKGDKPISLDDLLPLK